jgi:histone deacetylase 1/2
VFQVFLQFQQHVEHLFSRKIIHVQAVRGGEYHRLNKSFSDIGHKQNGTDEHKHRHIVETGLPLLTHASVPFHFWSNIFIAT